MPTPATSLPGDSAKSTRPPLHSPLHGERARAHARQYIFNMTVIHIAPPYRHTPDDRRHRATIRGERLDKPLDETGKRSKKRLYAYGVRVCSPLGAALPDSIWTSISRRGANKLSHTQLFEHRYEFSAEFAEWMDKNYLGNEFFWQKMFEAFHSNPRSWHVVFAAIAKEYNLSFNPADLPPPPPRVYSKTNHKISAEHKAKLAAGRQKWLTEKRIADAAAPKPPKQNNTRPKSHRSPAQQAHSRALGARMGLRMQEYWAKQRSLPPEQRAKPFHVTENFLK